MAFASNPLSLSVPEPAFESWLRDSGYLEILDHRTSLLHSLNSSSTTTTTTPSPTPSTTTTTTTTSPTLPPPTRRTPTTTLTAISYGLTMSSISSLSTIFSLLTLNPFAKLTSSDFSSSSNSHSLPWTSSGFLGSFHSYSFPSSATQAKMRVHENVKRFARNYASLLLLFFACSLYQMPLALVGLLSCLAMWELFRFCDKRWALERDSAIRQIVIRIAQCAVGIILFWSKVQMAVFCTLAVGYIVMMLHASFRKLTPAKQHMKGRGR